MSAKTAILAKVENFAKVVDEMIRANKLTQLKGPIMLVKTANLGKVAILARFCQSQRLLAK